MLHDVLMFRRPAVALRINNLPQNSLSRWSTGYRDAVVTNDAARWRWRRRHHASADEVGVVAASGCNQCRRCQRFSVAGKSTNGLHAAFSRRQSRVFVSAHSEIEFIYSRSDKTGEKSMQPAH